jgi:hypothetical protein
MPFDQLVVKRFHPLARRCCSIHFYIYFENKNICKCRYFLFDLQSELPQSVLEATDGGYPRNKIDIDVDDDIEKDTGLLAMYLLSKGEAGTERFRPHPFILRTAGLSRCAVGNSPAFFLFQQPIPCCKATPTSAVLPPSAPN